MNYKLKLQRDEYPDDPREWSNLGKMVCFHRRYNLGDEQPGGDPQDWLRNLACGLDDSLADRLDYWENGAGWARLWNEAPGWGSVNDAIDAKVETAVWKVLDERAVILPLYLYDHGGLRMSVGSFSCPWDSGQVGWIYASRADVLKNWGGKRLTARLRKRAEALLKAEVETYDQFLSGDVWGWAVYETDEECDCEPDDECDCTAGAAHVESCWGYYGVADALSEGKASLEWLEKETSDEGSLNVG